MCHSLRNLFFQWLNDHSLEEVKWLNYYQEGRNFQLLECAAVNKVLPKFYSVFPLSIPVY